MPTIVNGSKEMQAVLYTGTGATQTISGLNFQPDFVWIKSRSNALDHKLTDSVRGATKGLISNATSAETTDTNGVTAFTSTGFTLGSDSVYNTNGATYVAWCWKAGQGTTSSNTSGSITSTVSVNASAGFSIVTFTSQSSGTGTFGHGLGVAPSLVILKNRTDGAGYWIIYHASTGNGGYLALQNTNAFSTSANIFNNTSPTSSVFTLGSSYAGSQSTVAYCWSEIAGFSKFGSYTGNGSSDGPFIFTGFRPKFILYKSSSYAATDWNILDTSRDTYNCMQKYLRPNSSIAEANDGDLIDALSNGFKVRRFYSDLNRSGETYIYAAFAENPFKNSLAR